MRHHMTTKLILNNLFVLLLILLLFFLLSGCVSQNDLNTSSTDNQNTVSNGNNYRNGSFNNMMYRNGNNSRMMNITDAQRQQMVQQQLQLAIRACEGLQENDSCTMENTRGNMTGICELRNETLSCKVSFNRMRGPPQQIPVQN